MSDVVDNQSEVKFLKEIEDTKPSPTSNNEDVDFQDNIPSQGLIGTIPSSKIVKIDSETVAKEEREAEEAEKDSNDDATDDQNDDSAEDLDDDSIEDDVDDENSDSISSTKSNTKRNAIIGVIAGIALLLPISGFYLVNSDATTPPVTALKVIFHKQSFKATVPNHVIKMSYRNGRDAPAYIAFFKDGKWALSNTDDFGDNLESTTDAECVRHTGEAVAMQLRHNGVSPESASTFSELAKLPGIKTTMRYAFSKDDTRVELSIRVSPKDDFKEFHPHDTMRAVTDYDYVFANFKNTAKDSFNADMSTAFNGNIDKSSNSVVLSVIR